MRTGVSFLFFCLAFACFWGCLQPGDVEVVVHHHDPGQVEPGLTYFQLIPGHILCVTLDGEVLWNDLFPTAYFNGFNLGFDVLTEGNLLRFAAGTRQIIKPTEGTVLWQDNPIGGHHSLQQTPGGSVIFLESEYFQLEGNTWVGDDIIEVDYTTKQAVWTWRLREHLDPLAHNENPVGGDWSHGNTVKFFPNYPFGGETHDAILFLARNLHTLFMIDYPGGEILWSLGQHGTFGRREPPEEPIFMQPHEADMIAPNHFIIYDNGLGRWPFLSRVREFAANPEAGTVEEIWTWTDPDLPMADTWGGDANRLPNGNTLTINVLKGRIIEVNPSGEKVWEIEVKRPAPDNRPFNVYKCERVAEVP